MPIRFITYAMLFSLLAGAPLQIPLSTSLASEADHPALVAPTETAAEPLVLLTTIEVGGSPDAIVVDHSGGRNDVIFYNRSTQKVQFLDANSLTLAAEEISIPTWEWNGWIAYDTYHHQAYLVNTKVQNGWIEAKVNIIRNRQLMKSFSVNAAYNNINPTDEHYGIDGLAIKQPFSEGANPARLLIDNTPEGNVDVVDFNATGTDAARVQRLAYRPAVPPPSWATNQGNSLALEISHESLPSDDLLNRDILYISDKNHLQGWGLRALSINHPLQDLNPTSLPDVDLQNNCGIGGCQGVAMAEALDRFYVASGDQSFDNGYIDRVDTTQNHFEQDIELPYGDQYQVFVDDYDPKRVFVATFDHYYNDPDQALYLNLIYNGNLVGTLRLTSGFEEHKGPREMAFDPSLRRLYLTADTRIFVVQVNYGADPPLETTTARVSPEGGELVSPNGNTRLNFSAGAVEQPTLVTYTENRSCTGGDLASIQCFDLTAVISGTTTPVTSFDPPYMITISYTASTLGPIIENTLRLYWLAGNQWNPEPTSSLDLANHRVSASPNHMTIFACMGETRRVLLPQVLANR